MLFNMHFVIGSVVPGTVSRSPRKLNNHTTSCIVKDTVYVLCLYRQYHDNWFLLRASGDWYFSSNNAYAISRLMLIKVADRVWRLCIRGVVSLIGHSRNIVCHPLEVSYHLLRGALQWARPEFDWKCWAIQLWRREITWVYNICHTSSIWWRGGAKISKNGRAQTI